MVDWWDGCDGAAGGGGADRKRGVNQPSEMAYCGQLHASEGEAERSLETEKPKRRSLVEGRLWQATTGGDMPPLIHTMRHFSRQA
ncbi:MAG: hypothetical protein PUE80_09365 [bacterium]|nr:hypothetical protein [bacterium]